MTATVRPGAELAECIADAVRAHPAVAGLHGGPSGMVASYLPSGPVVGVRASVAGEPVELAVVLRFGHPVPAVAAELRAAVRRLAGPVAVDILVADLTEAA